MAKNIYRWFDGLIVFFRSNSWNGGVSKIFKRVWETFIIKLMVWLKTSMRSKFSKWRWRLCKRVKQANKYWYWQVSVHWSCGLLSASIGRTRDSRTLRSVIIRRWSRVCSIEVYVELIRWLSKKLKFCWYLSYFVEVLLFQEKVGC